ncbi:UbiA family prenyltransferase [Oerskovia paurometabola]|uniref:UbiA family prenyltransferase n=1 Tax=Oerskovia paurometabola TaxID=162170 RepID=A0ABW1XHL7_9CELL|nr:4-hydroxybenzoate polyprenyltransferase [Oerskovia paurometabola]
MTRTTRETALATAWGLALASHAGPTVVVTVLAGFFAAGVGSGPGPTALVTAAVLTGQLSVGWSNDWLDARRDVAVQRTDKPVVAGLVTTRQVHAAALVAAGLCVVLSLATGIVAGLVHLVAVASAWSYNAWLKSTVWSWAPYAVSFGLLPLFVVLAGPGRAAAPWAMTATALLGVGAHVANTLPDLEDDRATGIRGLPHRLGRTRASVLAPTVLVAAVAVVVLGPPGPPSVAAWVGGAVAVALAVSAGVVAVRRTASRLPFALSMAVAAVCAVLLVLAGPDVALPG